MSNPLFDAFGRNTMPGPFGNMQQMVQSFRQFRNTFQGDPKQTVMNMVNSGRITQQQLNMAQQMASQMKDVFK